MAFAVPSAATQRDQFLHLLVTQLQHQDPLSPINQEQFVSQLAQLSTVESLENLNKSFEKAFASAEVAQAAVLLGKDAEASAPSGLIVSGKIIEIKSTSDGAVAVIGDHRNEVPLKNIHSVR